MRMVIETELESLEFDTKDVAVIRRYTTGWEVFLRGIQQSINVTEDQVKKIRKQLGW